RKGPGAWLEWNALGHGPGGEDAVALEPEVVVEAAGGVLLNDEDRRLALRAAAPEGLRRLRGVALSPVGAEFRHGSILASSHIFNTPLKTLWMVWRTSSGSSALPDQAKTPIARNFARRARRSSASGVPSSSSSALTSARRRLAAAASGSFWAPPRGSDTISSMTPSS